MSYERPEDKWKREKQYQGPTPGQPNPPADEAQWMQEKQGRVAARPNQPQNPQEAQWMREKQGGQAQPPQPRANGQPSGQEQQWMREKQGGAPPAPPTVQGPAQGLLQYQSELYSQAVATIKPLYDESTANGRHALPQHGGHSLRLVPETGRQSL